MRSTSNKVLLVLMSLISLYLWLGWSFMVNDGYFAKGDPSGYANTVWSLRRLLFAAALGILWRVPITRSWFLVGLIALSPVPFGACSPLLEVLVFLQLLVYWWPWWKQYRIRHESAGRLSQ